MLEHVAADDEVEGFVVEGKGGDVGADHRPAGIEVDADVLEALDVAQTLLQTPFRGEVEQSPVRLEEPELVPEEEQKEAVALERAAPRTRRVRTPSVRKESPVAMLAAGTEDGVAAIHGAGSDLAWQSTEPPAVLVRHDALEQPY